MISEPDAVERARELLRDGEAVEAVRGLRGVANDLAPAEWADVVADAADGLDLGDLAAAAARVLREPSSGQALYDLGYACVEHGLTFLAVPALWAALQAAPGERLVVLELAVALRGEGRPRDAVAVLEEHLAEREPWPDGYLLAECALLAGDVERALRNAELPAPAEPEQRAAHVRLQAAVGRLRVLRGRRPLDDGDLRGWHHVVNGGVLAHLSPYGGDGMNGRYGWVQDTATLCRLGLDWTGAVLEAVGRRPRSVALLPDRGSTALGLAAATVLDLPARPYAPGAPDALVVAYDLRGVDEALLGTLADRPPGQVLLEHATCWTEPPMVAADVTVLLAQLVTAPWEERMRFGVGGVERTPADPRPAAELARDIVAAVPDPDPDPDDGDLADLLAAVGDTWPGAGPRATPVWSPGPVPSNAFR